MRLYHTEKRSRIWGQDVISRDGHQCQVCLLDGVPMHAHHLYSKALYPEFEFDVDNGICLCGRCHAAFHDTFGTRENSPHQLLQFLRYFMRKGMPDKDKIACKMKPARKLPWMPPRPPLDYLRGTAETTDDQRYLLEQDALNLATASLRWDIGE